MTNITVDTINFYRWTYSNYSGDKKFGQYIYNMTTIMYSNYDSFFITTYLKY